MSEDRGLTKSGSDPVLAARVELLGALRVLRGAHGLDGYTLALTVGYALGAVTQAAEGGDPILRAQFDADIPKAMEQGAVDMAEAERMGYGLLMAEPKGSA